MRRTLITIITIIIAAVGWFIYEKPTPPFGADIPVIVSQEPTYFAEIDGNGIVLRVLVVSKAFIDSGKLGDPKNWIETTIDGSKKKNYAGKGYTYRKEIDAFVAPNPDTSATLNESTGKWITLTPSFQPSKTASK